MLKSHQKHSHLMCFGSNMTSKILYQVGVEVLLKKKMDKQCKSHGKDIRRKFKCVKDMYLKLNPLDIDAHTHTDKMSPQLPNSPRNIFSPGQKMNHY